ncbi:hypothetical protein KVR801_70135 [Klebsiella variicola]|nr:hypothetical protein KVR801_70135 [Klebsiella variicola]
MPALAPGLTVIVDLAGCVLPEIAAPETSAPMRIAIIRSWVFIIYLIVNEYIAQSSAIALGYREAAHQFLLVNVHCVPSAG